MPVAAPPAEAAPASGGASDGAAGLPAVVSGLAKFSAMLADLERQATALAEVARKIEPGAASSGPVNFDDSKDEVDPEILAALKATTKKLQEENERLEGEVVSLRLFRDQTKDRIKKAVSGAVDMKLPPEAEEMFRSLVVDRDRLQEEKTKLETDLSRIKGEATRRISTLKTDLESVKKDHDTVRVQKDNLMRQLQARDAGVTEREITLEDITNSEIFKTMLANIRKTSRQEVTILHDAVASIKAIDPKAYDTVLEIVARAFKKAQVENPLAMLPRG